MRREPPVHPVGLLRVRGHAEHRGGQRRHGDPVGRQAARLRDLPLDEVGPALESRILGEEIVPVGGEVGVQVDKGPEPVSKPVGNARHDHPGIGMADHDRMLQLAAFDEAGDVVDMGVQADIRPHEVRPAAEPGEIGREDRPAVRLQHGRHVAPAPAAVPGAMDQLRAARPGGAGSACGRRGQSGGRSERGGSERFAAGPGHGRSLLLA